VRPAAWAAATSEGLGAEMVGMGSFRKTGNRE
jgi:hypothetical protein